MSDSNLTSGKLIPILFSQAFPMMLGIAAVFSIALVDTYFVGKLGTTELAALTFTFPVTMTIASLSSGLGAGTASLVSRTYGSGDKQSARRYSVDSLLLSCTIVALLSTIGYFTIDPLFSLLGAQGKTLDLIRRYMQIWYISMPFLVIPMVANAILRSVGNARWPGFIMVCSAVVNIVLTPVFIFGYGPIPAMSIEGAALGTLIARVFTFVLALYLVGFQTKMLTKTVPAFSDFIQSVKSILKIAVPAATGSIVNPMSIGVVTGIMAAYSQEVVAAFGVATRIESFASIPMLSLSAAIGPIVGQNWGANKKQRVISAVAYCYVFSVLWALIVATITAFFADTFTQALASDNEVANIANGYLYAVIISLCGYGAVIVSSATFNALGKPLTGLMHYFVRGGLLYIPLSFLASLFFDYKWVFYAICASNILAGIAIVSYTFYWLNKAKREDCDLKEGRHCDEADYTQVIITSPRCQLRLVHTRW